MFEHVPFPLYLPLVVAAVQVAILHYAYRVPGGLKRGDRAFLLLRAGWFLLLAFPGAVLLRETLGGLNPYPVELLVSLGLLAAFVHEASQSMLFRYSQAANKYLVAGLGLLGTVLLLGWETQLPQSSPFGFPVMLYALLVIFVLVGWTWIHRMRRDVARDAFQPGNSATAITTKTA